MPQPLRPRCGCTQTPLALQSPSANTLSCAASATRIPPADTRTECHRTRGRSGFRAIRRAAKDPPRPAPDAEANRDPGTLSHPRRAMSTTHRVKRTIVGALLSGSVALAGLGLGMGTAQAFNPQPDPPGKIRGFDPPWSCSQSALGLCRLTSRRRLRRLVVVSTEYRWRSSWPLRGWNR